VLFLFRVAAICVVLWMLTGPRITTTTRHEKPKSVVVMVDNSASMDVADPVRDTAMSRRWSAATGNAAGSGQFVVLDAAAATLKVGKRLFEKFAGTCRTAGRTDATGPCADRTLRAVEATIDRLGQFMANRTPSDGDLVDAVRQVRSDLTRDVLPRLKQMKQDAATGRLQLASDRNRQLDGLDAVLAEATASLARVADRAASAVTTEAISHAATSRREKVDQFLIDDAQGRWLERIRQQANVICYQFDEAPVPISIDGRIRSTPATSTNDAQRAPATDLAAAMEQVARDSAGRPVALAVWLTDGGHNRTSDPLRAARAADVPAFVVPVGAVRPVCDVILHHVQAPRAVFEEDLIVIEGTIDAHQCLGQDLTVELLEHDAVIDSTTIAVASDSAAAKIMFQVPAAELGRHTFVVRASSVPDEKVTDNNRAEVSVEVTEGVIRLFLADYVPRWEWRYLINLFKRDERLEFESVQFEPRTRGRGPRARGQGFPRTLDEWGRYRVIILGDLPPSVLDDAQQDLLEQYVSKRGGTLIIIAGDESMPRAYAGQTLAPLIPVTFDHTPDTSRNGVGLFLTAEGRMVSALQLADDPLSNERLWRDLTRRVPIFDLSTYSRPKPTSHVLIGAAPIMPGSARHAERTNTRAYLCWQAYGRGKVVYLASPSTYRLRFRRGDTLHHRFWAQLLRWAVARDMGAGSQVVRLITDKAQYAVGDDVQVTVYLNELRGAAVAGAACNVTATDGLRNLATLALVEDEQAPGVYRTILKDLPEGQIRLRVEGDDLDELLDAEGRAEPIETIITVEPPASLELRNTQCNLPLLTRIAESTGGLVVPPTGLPAALEMADLEPEVTISKPVHRPLWTRWLCVWIFVGVLTVEWAARKLAGLA